MRVEDWRLVPPSLVEPLYEAEARRWRLALEWDTSATLQTVERARAAGTLPGLVIRGPGQSIVGWTYFVVINGLVQIGSLIARSSDGIRLLLDAVLKAPEAAHARDVMFFGFPESQACESALARRRFDVTRYWYLRRTLDHEAVRAPKSCPVALRPLCDNDGPDAVRLLARAYAGQEAARCFAPNERLDEWAQYFAQMTRGAALGTLVPDATLLAEGEGARTLGLVVTTAIAPGTLHLAQLVVDPATQDRGIGGQLIDAAMAWGATHEQRLMTLLVNDGHDIARRLYASRGFLPTGYFLYARRAALRRTFPHIPLPARRPAVASQPR
jgi:ribosomal protein S18 acetylase RimI-like enzyme